MLHIAEDSAEEGPAIPGRDLRYYNILVSWGVDFQPLFEKGFKTELAAVQAVNRTGAFLAGGSVAVVGYDPDKLSPEISLFASWKALNRADVGFGYFPDRNIGPIRRHMAGAMALQRAEWNRRD